MRKQAVAHGPQAAGGQKGSGFAVIVILSRPHLVLAHLGDDDGVLVRHLVDGLNNVGAGQKPLVIAQGIHILHTLDVGDPLVVVHRVQAGVELAQNHLHIPDDAGVHPDVLVDLSRVHIQL